MNDPGIVDVFPELEAARAAANDRGATDLAAELEVACAPAVEDPEVLEIFEMDGGIAELEEPPPQPTRQTPAMSKPTASNGNPLLPRSARTPRSLMAARSQRKPVAVWWRERATKNNALFTLLTSYKDHYGGISLHTGDLKAHPKEAPYRST